MAATLADVEAKRVGKPLHDVEAEALVVTLSDTVSVMVAKTTAETQTCVQPEAQIKTEGDSVAGVETYTVSTH